MTPSPPYKWLLNIWTTPQKSLYVTHGDMLRICRIRRREHQDLPQYVFFSLRFLIRNSSGSFTNLEFRIYEFFSTHIWIFFNWQTEKKPCFVSIRDLFSFSTAQTEEKLWTKLWRQIGKNFWWIHKNLYQWPYLTIFSAHL